MTPGDALGGGSPGEIADPRGAARGRGRNLVNGMVDEIAYTWAVDLPRALCLRPHGAGQRAEPCARGRAVP